MMNKNRSTNPAISFVAVLVAFATAIIVNFSFAFAADGNLRTVDGRTEIDWRYDSKNDRSVAHVFKEDKPFDGFIANYDSKVLKEKCRYKNGLLNGLCTEWKVNWTTQPPTQGKIKSTEE